MTGNLEGLGVESQDEKLEVKELEKSPSGNISAFAIYDEKYIPVEETEKLKDHMEKYPTGKSELYIHMNPENLTQIDPDTVFKNAKILFDEDGKPQIFVFGKEVEDAATNAVKDPLTELDNREGLNIQLKKIAENIQREHMSEKYVTIGYYDLNFLKLVNDVLGHAEGDRYIVNMAKHLKDTLRLNDEVARVGGDEFVTVTISDIDIREKLKERLKASGKDLSYCAGLFSIKAEDLLKEIDFSKETAHLSRTDLVFQILKDKEKDADRLLYKAKEESEKNIINNQKPTVIVIN